MTDLLQTNYALDTFYFLVMGVLVMFMACGFSMLESGMVRAKNTAEILTKNVALYSIACIMYLFIGYQIMYGGMLDGGLFPSFEETVLGLGAENAMPAEGEYGGSYFSNRAEYFFQVVFVATAMSIVSGAVAERMKLFSFLIFAVVMTGFIYPVQGMWEWGGGFLNGEGFVNLFGAEFIDFAGSGLVHMCGAVAALTGVILLGARKGKYDPDGSVNALPGCNMPLATLGMFILWFGWFGFNGGSELKVSNFEEANAVAQVFVNTNIAACAGLIVALLVAKFWFGKADLTMALNGALAGLVAITAEPLAGTATASLIIGGLSGAIVVGSIVLLDRVLKIDDPVGAISVHGVCGLFGLLCVAFTNPDATFLAQLMGALVIFAWVAATSFITWYAIKLAMGLRVSDEEEDSGVDLVETGIEAYPEFVSTN